MTIPFTRLTHDTNRSTADRLFTRPFGADLVETRLFHPHSAVATGHLVPGVVERRFDGDQQSHGFANLFTSRFAVTDDAVELGDEIAVVGNPYTDGRTAVGIGHGCMRDLQGLGYCATTEVAV